MDAVRLISRCERLFDFLKLIYVYCIDLGIKKFIIVISFFCLEICCVFGYFSFLRELVVRRFCVFWSDDCKGKFLIVRSFVLINVKSFCYFTVIIFFVVFVSYLCRSSCIFFVFSCRLR